MLSKKQIAELKKVLIENLKNYNCEEKIKLNIAPKLLRKLIFQKGKDDNNNVYMEFDGELKELCKKLVLTGVSFANFVAENFDFSDYYGVEINPQTLYGKNLYSTILKGVKINGSFDDCYISKANFTGSRGAKVNPQTLWHKDLGETVLCDAIIIGPLKEGCNLKKTNFTGAIFDKLCYRKIDPQTILNKCLYGTNLKGMIIDGHLYDCNLEYTKFPGSEGAIIIPQRIDGKSLEGAILKDATIYGSLENCVIRNTKFEGSKGTVMSYEQYCELQQKNDLTDVKIDYEYMENLEEIKKAFQMVKK
ncbi:MAG: pentapeptide repeat-containing protein [Bacilli bacterium]|nr:pentapeptide repeat-containing protein [Bacilli bacterium]